MANFNYNKATIGGRITADPELKHTTQGTAVVSFTVAVNRKGKDQQTDFISCQAWKETAEFICRFFKKRKFDMRSRQNTDENGRIQERIQG